MTSRVRAFLPSLQHRRPDKGLTWVTVRGGAVRGLPAAAATPLAGAMPIGAGQAR
jgi:hypothetical protein